ncbi:UNVERIFIED_CONTAM: hypothetical protein NCL1_53734 [Trichonephila clavipes]
MPLPSRRILVWEEVPGAILIARSSYKPCTLTVPPICPFSTPAGTGTVTFFRCAVVPLPSQVRHGSLTIVFVPRQRLHVDFIMKGPVDIDSVPVPWQLVHLTGLLPGLHREP